MSDYIIPDISLRQTPATETHVLLPYLHSGSGIPSGSKSAIVFASSSFSYNPIVPNSESAIKHKDHKSKRKVKLTKPKRRLVSLVIHLHIEHIAILVILPHEAVHAGHERIKQLPSVSGEFARIRVRRVLVEPRLDRAALERLLVVDLAALDPGVQRVQLAPPEEVRRLARMRHREERPVECVPRCDLHAAVGGVLEPVHRHVRVRAKVAAG